MKIRHQIILVVTACTAAVLGSAGYGLWPLAFVAWVPALVLVERVSVGAAFGWGCLMGLTFWIATTFWMFDTIHNLGAPSRALSFLLFLVYCGWHGLPFGIVLVMARVARGAGGPTGMVMALWASAAGWAGLEGLYPMLYRYHVASTLFSIPVAIQSADLGGMPLVTFQVMLVAGLVYVLVRRRRFALSWGSTLVRGFAVPAAALLGLSLLYNVASLVRFGDDPWGRGSAIRVGVLQPDVDIYQHLKHAPGPMLEQLAVDLREVADAGVDLVILPESLSRGPFNYGADGQYAGGNPTLGYIGVPAILGGTRRLVDDPGEKRTFTAAFLTLGDGGVEDHYDKVVPIPFGERVPLGGVLPFLDRWFHESSGVQQGTELDGIVHDGHEIAVLICYEATRAEHARALLRKRDAELLVNISNDSFFGSRVASRFHFSISVTRAVELRRWLVRSNLRSYSAVVDPAGWIRWQGGWYEESFTVQELKWGRGETVFARIGPTPPALGFTLASLVLVALGIVRMRRDGSHVSCQGLN